MNIHRSTLCRYARQFSESGGYVPIKAGRDWLASLDQWQALIDFYQPSIEKKGRRGRKRGSKNARLD